MRYAAGAVPGRGTVVGRRRLPLDCRDGSIDEDCPGAARDWGTTDEMGGSVVRMYDAEGGKSVGAPLEVGGRLPLPLLDDGQGAPGSASSAGEGRNDWPPPPVAVGDGCCCWWSCCCCCWR